MADKKLTQAVSSTLAEHDDYVYIVKNGTSYKMLRSDFQSYYHGSNTDNSPSSTASEVYNFAQQGLGSEPTAFIIHHYTDGNVMQLDNVGTGNDILRLANAQNATNRPDQAADFSGDGNFIKLIGTNSGAGASQYTLMYIDKDGYFNYPRTTDFYRILLNKVDNSDYAFQFLCNNDQTYLVNFDNRFLVQTESASVNAIVSDRQIKFYADNSTNVMVMDNLKVDVNVPLYMNSSPNQVATGQYLRFVDTASCRFGTGNDLQINHDGTDNNFDLYNGDMVIRQNTTEQMRFERSTGKINAKDMNLSALPTSASGLSAGDLWNNSGVVNIV